MTGWPSNNRAVGCTMAPGLAPNPWSVTTSRYGHPQRPACVEGNGSPAGRKTSDPVFRSLFYGCSTAAKRKLKRDLTSTARAAKPLARREAAEARRAVFRPEIDDGRRLRKTRHLDATRTPLLALDEQRAATRPATTGSNLRAGSGSNRASRDGGGARSLRSDPSQRRKSQAPLRERGTRHPYEIRVSGNLPMRHPPSVGNRRKPIMP